jgi:hypothetical protein
MNTCRDLDRRRRITQKTLDDRRQYSTRLVAFGSFERGGFCGVFSLGFFSRVFVFSKTNVQICWSKVFLSLPPFSFLGFQAKGSKGGFGWM